MTNQELDKYLAENVMGWWEVNVKNMDSYWALALKGEVKKGLPQCARLYNDWHPTESISDAFQVVEKMLQDVKCRFDFTYHCEVGWRAIFHFCDKEYNAPLKGVDTAPLAISLAAKKAMET